MTLHPQEQRASRLRAAPTKSRTRRLRTLPDELLLAESGGDQQERADEHHQQRRVCLETFHLAPPFLEGSPLCEHCDIGSRPHSAVTCVNGLLRRADGTLVLTLGMEPRPDSARAPSPPGSKTRTRVRPN